MREPELTGAGLEAGALIHDAIGRAILRAGATSLQTSYSPVFRYQDGVLTPVFVTAQATRVDQGQADGSRGFPGITDRTMGLVALAMHRANLFLRDPDHLGYCENWSGAARNGATALKSFLSIAHNGELVEGDLIWRVPSDLAEPLAPKLVQARKQGVRICLMLDEAAKAHQLAACENFVADMVHLGPQWTGQWLDNVPGAPAMLASVARMIASRGSAVWIDGITTSNHLKAAIEAGATYLQGPHLAVPVIAGHVTGWRPLNAAALMETSPRLVALRHRG